jgi:hypothetical protein
MNVYLCKYHVLRCPKCGDVRSSTARKKSRCIKCAHGWEISRQGGTFGVLASFWLPADAAEYIQKYKYNREVYKRNHLDVESAFSVLGLSKGCTEEQFRDEYRRRAMMYHPDLNGGSEIANTMFVELNNAANHIRQSMGW